MNRMKNVECRMQKRGVPWLLCFIILSSSFCLRALGQQYSVDWFKVSGGGGSSTGSVYSVTGTLGQHDAGGPMTGGNYSLTGGFWSMIALVQEPAAPRLAISGTATNAVILFWPAPATGWGLQERTNLVSGSWSNVISTPVPVGDTLQVTVSPPAGTRFYRLHKP